MFYLKDYADYRIINYKDCNDNLLYQKVDCSFYDEYNEKTDSTPIRTLKLHTDKYGNYIIHNHKRFYLVEECKENKYNYDDYIIFLLSTDNFDISKKIRDMANTGEYGMNEIFEYCQYIARKFEKYDEDKYNYLSQYESFSNFLKEYDIEINNYLDYGTEFKIVEQK